jgi:hypothetical protein
MTNTYSRYALILGVIVAFGLRAVAASDNFWLDEVFTYYLAMDMRSCWDAITKVRIDHHILNTMYMYLVGDQSNWAWYRLLSVVTGTVSVLLLLYAVAGSGLVGTVSVLFLSCLSYPLVVYSSEARGYAPAIFFSLCSFLLIQRYWTATKHRPCLLDSQGRAGTPERDVVSSQRDSRPFPDALPLDSDGADAPPKPNSSPPPFVFLLFFWLSVILALLSHASSVCVYLAIGAWSLFRELHKDGSSVDMMKPHVTKTFQDNLKATCIEMAKCHLVPVIFLAWLYLYIVRQCGSIGGDILPLPRVLVQTLCLILGTPFEGIWPWISTCGVVSGFVLGIYVASKKKNHLWVFYVFVLVIAPAMMLIVNDRQYVYPRYFIVLFPFFFLMIAEALAWLYNSVRHGKSLYVMVLTLISAGNIILLAGFFSTGRGGYMKAIEHMASNTPGNEIVVGSDHDFRNGIMLQYYGRYLPAGKRLTYVKLDSWPNEGPHWAVLHSVAGTTDFQAEPVMKAKGGTYVLVKTYKSCSLSGLNWFLYRNSTRLPEAP